MRLAFSIVRQHLDNSSERPAQGYVAPLRAHHLFWFSSEKPCVVAVVNRSVAIASVGGQPAVLNGSLMADEDSGRLLQLVLSVAARDC